MPAFVLPQLLLCGLLVPTDQMASLLYWISFALPMTYAYDALVHATADDLDARLALDVAVVVGAIGLSLLLGAATLRRRTP
jgi:ABC-2 type transport system permease protein